MPAVRRVPLNTGEGTALFIKRSTFARVTEKSFGHGSLSSVTREGERWVKQGFMERNEMVLRGWEPIRTQTLIRSGHSFYRPFGLRNEVFPAFLRRLPPDRVRRPATDGLPTRQASIR